MTAKSSPLVTLPSLDPINLLVGQGMQAFGSIELFLGLIFASIMAPADRARSIAVIHSIRTVEAKLKVLAVVADMALTRGQKTAWLDLFPKITAAQLHRNKLAHWNASLYPGSQSIEDIRKVKAVLLPPVWSDKAMRTLWGKEQPLTEAQLRHIVLGFNDLTMELSAFNGLISKERNP